MERPKVIKNLIMSGGATRGIAFLGSYKALEELDKLKDIECYCGTSIGSIILFLINIGYTPDELSQELVVKELSTLKDIRVSQLLTRYGIDTGKKITDWIESMAIKKEFDKDTTFQDLFNKTNKKLIVVASNLNTYSPIYFSVDTSPDLRVIDAIRMSISIPILFTNKTYKGHIYVDGALTDNYPIRYFSDKLSESLGLKIVLRGELDSIDEQLYINNIEQYIFHVISCFIAQKERLTTHNPLFKNNTVFIRLDNHHQAIQFDMPLQIKQELMDIGYNTVKEFFSNA